jgi:hypothetical protein
MASVPDPLLRDALSALAIVLPRGYSAASSSLNQPTLKGDTWIVIRKKSRQNATCLLVVRRRVEPRDLGAIAARAARTRNPALLVSPYLSPQVRERLRGFGIGYWDLAGNAQIAIDNIKLCVERNSGCSPTKGADRSTRSLCGEMAGRAARALVDVRPPYPITGLAQHAHVEPSCASRVVGYLAESGMIERRPRGKIETVHWQDILRRWSLDAPFESRGEATAYLASRGLPDLLARLGASGFLHAITGELAFARLASQSLPQRLVMYVDDPIAAMTQFGLHKADDGANVVLVKPVDRSVFHRSREKDGLRYVSPSLAVADLPGEVSFERALAWMSTHEPKWRT